MMALNGGFEDTMASKWFSPTQGSCLTFSYLVFGLSINQSLDLKLNKENSISLNNIPVFWTVREDLGNIWYTHRLTIVSDLRWQILFSTHSESYSKIGIMAIDDINVDLANPCPLSGMCDFEVCF